MNSSSSIWSDSLEGTTGSSSVRDDVSFSAVKNDRRRRLQPLDRRINYTESLVFASFGQNVCQQMEQQYGVSVAPPEVARDLRSLPRQST